MQAFEGAGKEIEARQVYAQFIRAWAGADADLPEMRRAKELAATYGAGAASFQKPE